MQPQRVNRQFLIAFFATSIIIWGLWLKPCSADDFQPIELKINETDLPYSGVTGTYAQTYTISTAYGLVILRTNVDSGSISYITKSNGGKPHTILMKNAMGSPANFTFYGTDFSESSQAATIYSKNGILFVPINANPGGNCNAGNDVYILQWPPNALPKLSQIAQVSDDCLDGDFVDPKGAGLEISILEAGDLKIQRWIYHPDNTLTAEPALEYEPPAGFTALISANLPLVKEVATRYGVLSLDSNLNLLLNQVMQNVPSQEHFDINGFSSRVIEFGNQDLVVAMVTPDQATGIVFQILAIGDKSIHLSQLFGSGYALVSYKKVNSDLYLDTGAYDPFCNGENCEVGVRPPPGFTNGQFMISNAEPFALSSGSTVLSESYLPADILIISNTWYVLTRDDQCVSSTESPADLIRADQANALQDNVSILSSDSGGKPETVRIGTPEPNGLEAVTTFFRGIAACEQYKDSQDSQMNQLK